MYRSVSRVPVFSISNLIKRNITKMSSETPLNMRTDGPVITSITTKIKAKFPDVEHLAVFNNSYKHKGHEPMETAENTTESHIRLEIVTEAFKGLNLPKRHRLVYGLLKEEFDDMGLHALQLTTKTPEEYAKSQQSSKAQTCKGD
ncbi:BolA-like protein [Nakaseomyces glabratus]